MIGDGTVRGLTVATLVGSGVVGGVFYAFSTFVMPALRDLPDAQGIRAMQQINVAAPGPGLMIALVGTALLALALLVVTLVGAAAGGGAWRVGGALAALGSFVVTPAFHVPRNDRLAALDPHAADAAARWATYVHEWTIGNHVRGALAIAACAALALSLAAD